MNKKVILTIFFLAIFVMVLFAFYKKPSKSLKNSTPTKFWQIQSIDTVKYSRDLAREKLNDPSFDQTIDQHVRLISETGATHIAIGTPYDSEFVPFLIRWVKSARKYNLKVWFRGNVSGWEGWFGYPLINRQEHITKIAEFIKANPQIFENGDIFSPCTECENGGPGDPRHNGDLKGHREFLIKEYNQTNQAFRQIGKNIRSLYPMNGDVARLIMDPSTTQSLGGIVVIDHYVNSPTRMINDIKNLAQSSNGKIVIGEFGAPIPDIHGQLSEQEQSDWLKNTLTELYQIKEIIGINYWVNVGGSTQLWDSKGNPRLAVNTLSKYYTPKNLSGIVINEINKPISNITIKMGTKSVTTKKDGLFQISYLSNNTKPELISQNYKVKEIQKISNSEDIKIIMVKNNENILFKIRKTLYNLIY